MRRSIEIVVLMGATLMCAQRASAQTISEYSRAQRAVIDTAIQRQTPRPLAVVTPTLPSLPPMPLPSSREVASPAEGAPVATSPRVLLTGIVAFADRRVAEVTVDDVSHVLAIGDEVPGTSWMVHEVSATDIVMAPRRPSPSGRGSRLRTFSLATAAH